MSPDYIKCYGDLQQELENAKHTLVTLNDNIRRIVGRTPKETRVEKQKTVHDKKGDHERLVTKMDLSRSKRRSGAVVIPQSSVFSRLSAPVSRSSDDESKPPRLYSRVIKELPTRQEVLAAQCADSESRARNRRIFGSLLGTLQKFCVEESRLKQKEEKKAQIEKRLEDQEIQERELMKRERALLFEDRKRKQLEIKKLELKMNRLKDFEYWESSVRNQKHHIRTKSRPYVYYRPRVLCKKSTKLLTESEQILEEVIKKKRDELNKELSALEESFNEELIEQPNKDGAENKASNRLTAYINSSAVGKSSRVDENSTTSSDPIVSSIVVVKNADTV